jgi:hypothetical protein
MSFETIHASFLFLFSFLSCWGSNPEPQEVFDKHRTNEMHPAAQHVFLYFQNLYDLDEEDDVVTPVPTKQMKFAASGGFLHHVVWHFPFAYTHYMCLIK